MTNQTNLGSKATTEQTIKSLTLSIVVLALDITNQDNYHVFVNYHGHVKKFEVDVHCADADYEGGDHKKIYSKQCNFDKPEECVGDLKEIIVYLKGWLV